MTDQPALPPAEAKRRFFVYLFIRFGGLGLLGTGLALAQGGITIASGVLIAAGLASLFIRPRMLGILNKPRP